MLPQSEKLQSSLPLLGVFDQTKLIVIRVRHHDPLDAELIKSLEFAASQLLHAADGRIKVANVQIYVDAILLCVAFRHFLEQQLGALALVPELYISFDLPKNIGSQDLGPELATDL
jgi:hypothetical protein